MEQWGVIFYDNSGFIADSVELLTGEWSHCGFIYPDGIHVADVNYNQKFLTRHFNAKHGTYEIVILDLIEDQNELLQEFILKHKQVEYDITGALECVVPAFDQDPQKLYCSEAVRNGLIHSKYISDSIAKQITPTQLYYKLKGESYD